MKQRERHAIYEAAALIFAGMGLAITVPALVSAHENIALIAAAFLVLAWAGWGSFFVYRQTTKGN